MNIDHNHVAHVYDMDTETHSVILVMNGDQQVIESTCERQRASSTAFAISVNEVIPYYRIFREEGKEDAVELHNQPFATRNENGIDDVRWSENLNKLMALLLATNENKEDGDRTVYIAEMFGKKRSITIDY